MQTRVTRFLERKEKNRGWNGSKIVHAKKKKISDRCSFTWNRVCQHVLPFLSPPLFCFLFPRKQLDREINFTWQSSNYRHIWPTKLPRINKVRQMFKNLMSWEKNEIKKKVKRKSGKVISEIKRKKVNQRRFEGSMKKLFLERKRRIHESRHISRAHLFKFVVSTNFVTILPD